MEGICKLTGIRGKFVKSHILPKALTKLNNEGLPYIQYGIGSKPTKRWDSWYDTNLVTKEGEAILAEYDDAAIKILRNAGLIWSSPHFNDELGDNQFREIYIENAQTLRLFFLSCIWRACKTQIHDYKNIKMDIKKINQLQNMITNKTVLPKEFLPISLITLSKAPEKFNYTITYETKEVISPKNNKVLKFKFYRIYFEGLIAHVNDVSKYSPYYSGKVILCNEEKVLVIHKSWENSYQKETLEQAQIEYQKIYHNT